MSYNTTPIEQALAQSSPWINRRATVRYHCGPATPGRVLVAEKEAFVPAWILDLSLSGIGLLLNRPLEVGMTVLIQMKGTKADQVYRLTAQIMHATNETNGDWIIGCAFIDPLSRDQLDDLL